MGTQIQQYIKSRRASIETAYRYLRDAHPDSKPEELGILLMDGAVHGMPKTELLEGFKNILTHEELEEMKTTPKPAPPMTVAIWVLCIQGLEMDVAIVQFAI